MCSLPILTKSVVLWVKDMILNVLKKLAGLVYAKILIFCQWIVTELSLNKKADQNQPFLFKFNVN
jgi:hypothetical protein